MALQFARDGSAADWLAHSATPWSQLVTLGPSGFPAYGRLRYIPDPVDPVQSENDIEVSNEHPDDLEQAGRALAVLHAFTTTPDNCYFCMWDGYDEITFPPERTPPPWVVVPNRRYALLQGRLRDLDQWQTVLGNNLPPAFIWPADHSWVFSSDVDPHWAGIASSEPALQALLRESDLDVVPADPRRPQPTFAPPAKQPGATPFDGNRDLAHGSRWGLITELSP